MFKKIKTSFLILIITLFLLEITLRFFSSGFLWLRNPVIFTNHDSSLRILTVGESTTAYGFSKSYPRQLEKILEKKLNKKVQVKNISIPGADTKELLQNLPNYLREYKPHIVTFMTGINDGTYSSIHENFWGNFATYRLARLILFGQGKIVDINLRKDAQKWAHAVMSKRQTKKEQELLIEYLKKNSFKNFSVKDFIEKNNDSKFILKLLTQYYYLCRVRLHHDCIQLFQALTTIESLENSYRLWFEYFRASIGLGDSEQVHKAGMKLIQMQPQHAYNITIYAHNNFNEVQGWKFWEVTSDFYSAWRKSETAKDKQREILKLHLEFLLTTMNSPFLLNYDKIKNYSTQLIKSSKISTDDEINLLHTKIKNINGRVTIGKPLKSKKFILDLRTQENQRAMAQLAKNAGAQIIVLQYPMLSIEPLKQIYFGIPVTFVENKEKFESLVESDGYSAAFIDSFAVDFGHFTPKGHQLVAEELSNAILNMENLENPDILRSK